jgi:hypothetical protein
MLSCSLELLTLVGQTFNLDCLRPFSFRVTTFRPPLWSSGQSSWLQIQRSRFRFPALPDFLERGPLNLVSDIEELLGKKSRESENMAVGIRHADALYPQKLALTLPTSGGRSVSIVRSRTHSTEFSFHF